VAGTLTAKLAAFPIGFTAHITALPEGALSSAGFAQATENLRGVREGRAGGQRNRRPARFGLMGTTGGGNVHERLAVIFSRRRRLGFSNGWDLHRRQTRPRPGLQFYCALAQKDKVVPPEARLNFDEIIASHEGSFPMSVTFSSSGLVQRSETSQTRCLWALVDHARPILRSNRNRSLIDSISWR